MELSFDVLLWRWRWHVYGHVLEILVVLFGNNLCCSFCSYFVLGTVVGRYSCYYKGSWEGELRLLLEWTFRLRNYLLQWILMLLYFTKKDRSCEVCSIIIVENYGSWWPKYRYRNIKFTLGITINVDTYLFYKRFLKYSSIHTCTRLKYFFPYPTFCRLLTDRTVYIRLFLSRRAHTCLHTLISTYEHLHYAFDLVQHKNYTYLNNYKY